MIVSKPIEAQDVARIRYEALRKDRPDLFLGGGPIALDVDRHEAGVGVVHADPWIMFVVDPVVMPDGRSARYGRLIQAIDAESVAVLPVTSDGRVLLLRHWRHATQSWHLEIPRGFGEIGLPPKDQAAAELWEEMGICGELVAIGHIYPDTGMTATRVALFVAKVSNDVQPMHREGLASIVEMTISQFKDAILNGSVNDSFALAAWTRYSVQTEARRAS